jgi:hypothetical protein
MATIMLAVLGNRSPGEIMPRSIAVAVSAMIRGVLGRGSPGVHPPAAAVSTVIGCGSGCGDADGHDHAP